MMQIVGATGKRPDRLDGGNDSRKRKEDEEEMRQKRFIGSKWSLMWVVFVAVSLAFSLPAAYGQAKKVDLNSATQKELEDVKGVGPATAKKIVANRPYKSVDELKKAGLSDKQIKSIGPSFTVGAAPAPAAAPAAKPAPAVAPAPQRPLQPNRPPHQQRCLPQLPRQQRLRRRRQRLKKQPRQSLPRERR